MLTKCQKGNYSVHACIYQLIYSLTHLINIFLLSTTYQKSELEIGNAGQKKTVPV